MKLLIFHYKPVLSQSFQFVHYQLFNSQTKMSSFDASFFLTPTSNPSASDFSSNPWIDVEFIHSVSTITCHHLWSGLLQESPISVSQLLSLLWGMISWQAIFYFLLEKEDRISPALLIFLLFFNKHTWSICCGQALFLYLRDNPKYKKFEALPDRRTKYSTEWCTEWTKK